MSWAEGAVRRVVALHARTSDGYCEAEDWGSYEVEPTEWPCATLEALWQLGHTEGPMPLPIQGPRIGWQQGLSYAVQRAQRESERRMARTPEQQEAIRGLGVRARFMFSPHEASQHLREL